MEEFAELQVSTVLEMWCESGWYGPAYMCVVANQFLFLRFCRP